MNTDYQAIAAVINGVGAQSRGNADILLRVAQGLAEIFGQDQTFNRSEFVAACFAYQKGE